MKKLNWSTVDNANNGKGVALLPEPNTIHYDTSKGGALSPVLLHILQGVRKDISEVTVEDGDILGSLSNSDILQLIYKHSERSGVELSSFERDKILGILEKEQRQFGLLQELVNDPKVSDIIIRDFSHIAVQIGRKTYNTSLSFPDQEFYEAFVERLLQKAGTTYSTKKPVADGMVGDIARIHVVHKCLCDTGPYLTIRLNRFSSVTKQDLVKFGLAPDPVMEYLCRAIKSGQTLLIVGEVGTGKTTLARAIASSIPEHESILVIEDTPEIKLEHPQVRYLRTREANVDDAGRISPSECIRAGMRMAMNRIIFGEIRDAEAAEAFVDVCSSGHPGLSTIHAKSAIEATTRLELFLGRAQKGVSRNVIFEQISTAVQVIVFVNICKITGRRRIMEVFEINGYADGALRQREMFRYQAKEGFPQWIVVNKVSNFRDKLEEGDNPLYLNGLANVLTLDEADLFRQSSGIDR